MNKQSRQFAIRQIITGQVIANQDELCQALRTTGFDVTQATLSRDLKEMGIARVSTTDGARYVIHSDAEDSRLRSLISYEIQSIESNESLVIVRTLPGRAQGVAEIIDNLHSDLILGTIAGDNTIFIAPRSTAKIPELIANLREMIFH